MSASSKMRRDFGTYAVTNVVSMHNKSVYDLKWNIDGSYLGSMIGKNLKIGQLLEGSSVSMKCIHTVPSNSSLSTMCWNPANPAGFAFCGDDKVVELWDVRSPRAAMKVTTQKGNINISWSPDGKKIVLGNKDDIITVIDVASGTTTKAKFPYEVNELHWTANSDFILSATGDNNGLGAIDLMTTTSEASLKAVDCLTAHTSVCTCLKIDAGYRRMAVGGNDSLLTLWDLDDLICRHSVSFDSEIRNISFSGDGQYLAGISDQPILAIINSDTGDVINKINTRNRVTTVAWHPSSTTQLIAVALDDRSPTAQCLKFVTFPNCV